MNKLRRVLSWLGLTVTAAASLPSVGGAEPAVVATPDAPVGFGYKVKWFAVRTDQPARVAQTLKLTDQQPANWRTGIEAAYAESAMQTAHPRVFVSPAIDGWVWVVGVGLPMPDLRAAPARSDTHGNRQFEQLFDALAKTFPDVQYFASHRGVGLDGWARARAGRIERIFLFADGEVYANVGVQTHEERQLKFFDVSGLSPAQAGEALFARAEQRGAGERNPLPDEEDTMAIAAAWSINPSVLEDRHLPASAGLVGQLP